MLLTKSFSSFFPSSAMSRLLVLESLIPLTSILSIAPSKVTFLLVYFLPLPNTLDDAFLLLFIIYGKQLHNCTNYFNAARHVSKSFNISSIRFLVCHVTRSSFLSVAGLGINNSRLKKFSPILDLMTLLEIQIYYLILPCPTCI